MGLDASALEEPAERRVKQMKTTLQITIGIVMLLTGISLVLAWWPSVVVIFKGVFGGTLAIVGLIILYLAGANKK